MTISSTEPITSETVAELMRRINDAENVLTFGSLTKVDHGNSFPTRRIACDKSGGLYFTSDLTPGNPPAVDRRGVATSDYDLNTIVSFVDVGNDPGEVNLVYDIHANPDGVWISDRYKDPDDNVSGNTDDARIQKFDFDGNLQLTIRKLATVSDDWLFEHVVAFSDKSIIATVSVGANPGIYSYDENGENETLLLASHGAGGLVVNNSYGSIVASGTTTDVSTDKLVDSTQSFTGTVSIGDIVRNRLDETKTTVTAVDSDTQLTLNADIMVSGEDYTIQGSNDEFMTPIAGNKFGVYNQAGTLQRELDIDPPPGTNGLRGADMYGLGRILIGGWDPDEFLGVSDFYIEDGTDTIISSVELRDDPTGGVSTQYLCVSEGMRIFARDGKGISYRDLSGITFTDWYRYPNDDSETGKVLIGSDFGLSIPENDDFSGFHVSYFEIRDMRDAIEALIGDYKISSGANPYNLIPPSPDNIFKLAIDSGQSDWTTPNLEYLSVIPADAYEDIRLILDLIDISLLV